MLKIDGKPFDPNEPTPTEKKLADFLRKAPQDEVFTTANVAKLCRISINTMRYRGFTAKKCFDGISALIGPKRYWGHPKAIAELLRQVNS